MGPGTATTPAGMGYLSTVAGINGAVHYGILNETLFETIRWNASHVVGEIGWIQWGEVTAICLPQNRAEGSLYIAIDANHSLEWIPDQTGYLTAGCGSDGDVHAAANDASWLEVRYDPADWNSIHDSADETLGTTPEPEPEIEQEKTDKSLGILWLPFIGSAIFVIIAQFATNSDTRRMIQIGAILMIMLGLIMAGTVYNSQVIDAPDADSSERTRAATLVPSLHDGLAENEVLVAFHFPESVAPDGCTESALYYQETGQFWPIESPPDGSYCIVVSTIKVEVGTTIEMVTISTLDEYQYTYEFEQQTLGSFLRNIGAADGGTDGHWWSYDLNGGYGTIGIAEQAVEPGDHIDWHFDIGQF
jgi:hypothetical protein